jgi:hypothetical protein
MPAVLINSHMNLTVADYFNNVIFYKDYVINATPTILNLDCQLQLVKTALQSYELTTCDIYGNVTFSEFFNALDPALWDDVTIGALDVLNGRVRMRTFVPGDQVFLYTLNTYPVRSTVTVYAWTSDITDNYGIAVGGWNNVFPAGMDYWNIQTDPGGGEWVLETRQGGLIGGTDNGGVVAANTWYKIVVTMTWNHIWATIYNPDETVNTYLDAWMDDQPAPWGLFLENAANAVPTTTLFDLFVVQGNTGYSKTLPFTDNGETLLMPDDYVFNGTANNHQIRFQVAATIALVQNRLIQLVAPCVLHLNFFDLDGWGVEFVKCRVYVNGTRLNDPTFTNTSAIWHYCDILVTDYYGNTLYSNPSYPVTQSPLTADIQLQLVRVSIASASDYLSEVWIDQVGSGVNPKNMTLYGSGETQLYATALGITYRFTGWLNTTYITSTGTSVLLALRLDSGNVVITTAQNRIITLMTNINFQIELDKLKQIYEKPNPPVGSGGTTPEQTQDIVNSAVSYYTGKWWTWVLVIVGVIAVLLIGVIAYYKAKAIVEENKRAERKQQAAKRDKELREMALNR